MTIQLLAGDCRDVLPTLAADSVHTVVTSPPYYGLRDYGTALWDGGDAACSHVAGNARGDTGGGTHNGNSVGFHGGSSNGATRQFRDTCGKCGARRIDRQIGLEATPDEYLATMVAVFREVKRVLRPEGTVWLNVGSSYASGGKRPNPFPAREHVPACDSGDTAPRGYPALGCAYPDPDDEHPTGFPSHHARTSDSSQQPQPALPPDALTVRGSEHQASLGALPLLRDVPASTIPSSSANVQDAFGLEATAWAGLSGAQTSLGAERLFADSLASPSATRLASAVSQDRPSRMPCNEATDGASASRIVGKDAGLLSCDCGSCGICFAYSAIPMLQFKAKDLMLMPELLALALQADGWYIRSDIIIAKKNPMPESAKDRPTSAHEHVFLLTKNSRYFFDQDAVREPQAEGTIERFGNGNAARKPAVKQGGSERQCDTWRDPVGVLSAGRNIRNVWDISTEAFGGAHFATMPTSVVERCIRAGTSERGCCAACGKPWGRITERTFTPQGDVSLERGIKGAVGQKPMDASNGWDGMPRGSTTATTTGWQPGCDHGAEVVPCTVLDPFAGAGTTLLVADRLQRDAIGIELNVAYTRMAMDRCIADAPLFTSFPPAEPPEDERIADLFQDMAAE